MGVTKEQYPYTQPHNRERDKDSDTTFRDEEEAVYEEARRKGNVMDLVKKEAEEAVAKLFAEPAKPAPVAKKKSDALPAKKTVAKKTAKKAVKKSAKSK